MPEQQPRDPSKQFVTAWDKRRTLEERRAKAREAQRQKQQQDRARAIRQQRQERRAGWGEEQKQRRLTIQRQDMEDTTPAYLVEWEKALDEPPAINKRESTRRVITTDKYWVTPDHKKILDKSRGLYTQAKKDWEKIQVPIPEPYTIVVLTAGDMKTTGEFLYRTVITLGQNRPLDTVTVLDLATVNSIAHVSEPRYRVTSEDYLNHLTMLSQGDTSYTHEMFFPPIGEYTHNVYLCPGGGKVNPDTLPLFYQTVKHGVHPGLTVIHCPVDTRHDLVDPVLAGADSVLVATDTDPKALGTMLATLEKAGQRRGPILAEKLSFAGWALITGEDDTPKGIASKLASTRTAPLYQCTVLGHVNDYSLGIDGAGYRTLLIDIIRGARRVKAPLPHDTVTLPERLPAQESTISDELDERLQRQIVTRGERTLFPKGLVSLLGTNTTREEETSREIMNKRLIQRMKEIEKESTKNTLIISLLIVFVTIAIILTTVITTIVTGGLEPDQPHGMVDSPDAGEPINIATVTNKKGEEQTITGVLHDDVDIPKGGYRLTYRVTTTGNIKAASVTYLDEDARQRSQAGIGLPWEKSLGFYPESTPIVSVATTGVGTVTCQIVKNGDTIIQESESGTNPSIQCGS